MSTVHDITPPSDRDAPDWYARLHSGAMTDAEAALLDDWLADPEHAAAFTALHAMDARIQDVAGATESEVVAREKRVRRRFAIGVGAFGAVAAGLIAFVGAPLVFNASPSMERWSTSGSGIEMVVLPDGSQITLNTRTAVEVAYTEDDRSVHLLRGEAYFDVITDAARPFSVYTDESEFRVVGTRFTVRSEDEGQGDLLQVAEGGVQVFSDDRAVGDVVTAGGLAYVKPGVPVRYEAISPDMIADWRDGVITFSNTTLLEVRDSVQRYLPMEISFADESIAQVRVTAVFNISQKDTFLEGIATAGGFNLRYDFNAQNGRRVVVIEADQ
mgnify:CR=1 FL=1